MRTVLTLLRHGLSEANAGGILQGQTDWPLSQAGRQQSQDLVEFWFSSGVRFTTIISSPLTRALETAHIIASRLDCPVEEDPQLMERNWGRFEGKPLAEMHKYYAENPSLSLFDPAPPDGESFWQLYARAGSALQNLVNRPPGEILVVSHGGLLAAMHMIALQIAPAMNSLSGPRIALENCGFSKFEFDHQRYRWVVHCINLIQISSRSE